MKKDKENKEPKQKFVFTKLGITVEARNLEEAKKLISKK
jgi:hypothetical protein